MGRIVDAPEPVAYRNGSGRIAPPVILPRLERPLTAPRLSVTPHSSPKLAVGPDGLNPYRWIILSAVLTGAFLELLDTTSINVALRQMAGNLGATMDEIAWVSTGYILSNIVVLPLTAWLSSLFGRRMYLTYSILVFTVASLFCGASTTLGALVFWRVLQGAGGAALLSTAQATLREVFPKEQQGMVQALYITVVVVGPTLGPTFGGWITDNYTWPWIFYGKSPIGFVAAFLVWRFLQDSVHQTKAGRVDFPEIGLLAVGLASLQYVLEEGERYDWFDDPTISRLAVIAAITLVAFVVWELSPRNASPVVNLRILLNKEVSAGSALLFVAGFALYAGSFIFPLMAQGILGFTPTETGIVFLPGGIATIVGTLICGKLLNGHRPLVKPQFLIFGGMIVFAYSQWMFGHLTPQSGFDETVLATIIRGASLGVLLTPITVASLSTLRGTEIAQGTGLTNLFRQLGGSFGIAAINTYVVNHAAYHRANLVGDLFSGSQALSDRESAMTQVFVNHGYSLTSAHAAAVGALDQIIETQSHMMAYNDAFLLVATLLILALPTVLLFGIGRKKRVG